MSKKDAAAAQESSSTSEANRKRLVEHVEVTCEAFLGSGTITVGRLDALATGDTVVLESSPADSAEIRINGQVVARGEIITVDDRFAIRITEIG